VKIGIVGPNGAGNRPTFALKGSGAYISSHAAMGCMMKLDAAHSQASRATQAQFGIGSHHWASELETGNLNPAPALRFSL